MPRPGWLLALVFIASLAARAQFQIQDAHTTADLRGIDNIGGGVAWASGTNGTVLRTEDGGYLWQACSIPPGAEHLDFRGIQAFDANTAIVMSSGKGDLSRLYKTTDGCQTWKLLFTNPDAPEGFWDDIVGRVVEASSGDVCPAGSKIILGTIFGDPAVHRSNRSDTTTSLSLSFYLANFEAGVTCPKDELFPSASSIFALPGETAFAASNSVLARLDPYATYWMAVGRRLIQYETGSTALSHFRAENFCDIGIPFTLQSPSAGVFSLAIRQDSIGPPKPKRIGGFDWKRPSCPKADMVVVGGDYSAANDTQDTAAFTAGSNKFSLAQTPPHGYRSSVAYDAPTKTWITVGPNGTDISTDDGRNWRAAHPDPALREAPDADRNWNALSLPFVVGPHGRIGKLDPQAIAPPSH